MKLFAFLDAGDAFFFLRQTVLCSVLVYHFKLRVLIIQILQLFHF